MAANKVGFPNSVNDQILKQSGQHGHRITAGLSVINRTGFGPISKVWLPQEVLRNHKLLSSYEFQADWIAIREVDIARQHTNMMSWDMDVEKPHLSTWGHSYMVDNGYRLVVLTMGKHERPATRNDELKIFDDKLRERIQSLVSIMWHLERGQSISEALARELWFKGWNEKFVLPDIGLNIAGIDLMSQHKSWENAAQAKKLNAILVRRFLDLVGNLRKERFHSNQIMLGLQIPDFGKKHQKMYSPGSENRTWTFNNFLADVFGKFDMWAVDARGIQPTVIHLPTYHQRKKAQSGASGRESEIYG